MKLGAARTQGCCETFEAVVKPPAARGPRLPVAFFLRVVDVEGDDMTRMLAGGRAGGVFDRQLRNEPHQRMAVTGLVVVQTQSSAAMLVEL